MSVEFLRATPLFNTLTDDELLEVETILREENQPGGSTLFRSDETCDDLYLLRSGYVRLLDQSGSALATLGPGSLLGEAEFLRGLPYNTSAVAAADVQMLALPDESLRHLLQSRFDIGIKLSQNFGEQIAQLEDYLVEQLANTPALGDLPRKVLWPMARSMQPYQLQRGSFLYQTGGQAEGFFLLEKGALELQPAPSSDQPHPSANVVQPGSLFGVLPLLTNKPYNASAFAVDECLVWTLTATTFHNLSSQFPQLRRSLGRHSRSRLSVADQTQAVVRLAQTPLFANLEPAHLHAIVQRLVLQHVPAGESIYRLGDSSDALFLVDQGEVELNAENSSGVIQELARIKVGNYLGAMSLLTSQDRMENATANRNTNLWVLYKTDLDELVNSFPAIGTALGQAVASRPGPPQESVDEEQLRRFPLLSSLSSRELREVARHLKLSSFDQGEQIFRAGAPGEALLFIDKGTVRFQPLNGGGGWTRGEGEIIGERAILTDEPYGQSAFAETNVNLLFIEQTGLETLLSRLPSLASDLNRLLGSRINEADESMGAPPHRTDTFPAAPTGPRRRATFQPDGYPPPPPHKESWFGNLSLWAKLRFVLVALLLVYLAGVAVWLLSRGLF